MNKIPIILASDENCAKQMYVTIFSAIKNKNSDSIYDFYLLVPKLFRKNIHNKFKQLETTYDNVKINFIIMSSNYEKVSSQVQHITYPTYYRLEAASLFPQYDKVIYIDTDIIVGIDLEQFYKLDVQKYYIGASQAIKAIDVSHNQYKKYYEDLGIVNKDNLINAGVLLMNLAEIRKDNKEPELLDGINKNYRNNDNDIINIVLKDKIKIIDRKFNFIPAYLKRKYIDIKLEDYITEQDLQNANEQKVIFHYIGKNKPWVRIKTKYDKIWWKYAIQTPFYTPFNKFILKVKKFLNSKLKIKEHK